ncbi:MAG TPA: DegT/DnrJ/EryC1/StrS aminotransferase family protein [Limnobacter sp.]
MQTNPIPMTRPSVDEDTIAAVAEVLRSGWLTTGPKCRELEKALSDRAGGRPVRLVNSATAALELALRIAGIGPGDEVITTALSWVATANVILTVGARPVFVDIDPRTRLIDPDLIEAAITPRTKALMPVDLAGLPVDRSAIYTLAQRHGLRVIEDAAQSQGARWNGHEIGSMGDLVAFSFHPNKNMTTGEGGCLVMSTEEETELFERLRLQGVKRNADGTYGCDVLGGKSNMTDIAAAIGLGQLKQLDAFNAHRKTLVRHYFQRLSGTGYGLPVADFENSNWHMFQILIPENFPMVRAELMARLKSAGITTGVHYPAIHLLELFRQQGWTEGQLPHTESVARRILTLPLFSSMTLQEVDRVCDAVVLEGGAS